MEGLACSPWCVFKGSDSAPPEKAAFPQSVPQHVAQALTILHVSLLFSSCQLLFRGFELALRCLASRIGSDALLVAMTTDTSKLRKEELISAHSLRGQSAMVEKAQWEKHRAVK